MTIHPLDRRAAAAAPALDGPAPIFILGMLQRTGTNHLADLFELHRDVTVLKPVFEDHLVRWSPHLRAYVDDVTRCWTDDWNVPEDEAAALLHSIGGGITRWLQSHAPGRHVVTKMPSVENAHNFFALFPHCPVVVLVRDGRNVVQSGVTSFGWSYERAIHRWATAARTVLELRERHGSDPRFNLVRYEDVIADEPAAMRRLADRCGLDPSRFRAEATETLPVRGSSSLRAKGGEAIHWEPQPRTAEFDPSRRWEGWDRSLHARFNAAAADLQLALGYEIDRTATHIPLSVRPRQLTERTQLRYRELKVRAGRTRRAVRRTAG